MTTRFALLLTAALLGSASPALAAPDAAKAPDNATQKADEKKTLAQIVLPNDPTREQCAAYITRIRDHVGDRIDFSFRDPETARLREIPEEHRDLLFDEIINDTPLDFYALILLKDADFKVFRERVIASLHDQPANIALVVSHGWLEDARPAILDHLGSVDREVQPVWFQAFVEVAEPEHYAKLHQLTVQSKDALKFLPLLETLPNYDVATTIDACWKASDDKKSVYYRLMLAPYVAGHGNVEALGVLIENLQSSLRRRHNGKDINTKRLNAIKYIDFRGSNAQIKEWFEANRDKLVFDQFTKRFVIPEDF